MSTTFTPTGAGPYAGSYTEPDDGDPPDAAAWNVMMEGIAENVAFMEAALGASSIVGVTFTRTQQTTPIVSTAEAANWTIDLVGTYTAATAAGTGATLYWPLDLPHGAVLGTVSVKLRGAIGHAAFPGGKPGSMPTIQVLYVDLVGGGANIGAAAIDSSSTAGAFESFHSVTTAALAHTVSRTARRYYVSVQTEYGGGGAIAGDVITGVVCTYTMPSGIDGAAA